MGLNDGPLDQRTNAISSLPLIMEPISSIARDQRPPSKIESDGHCFFLLFHNIRLCDQSTNHQETQTQMIQSYQAKKVTANLKDLTLWFVSLILKQPLYELSSPTGRTEA